MSRIISGKVEREGRPAIAFRKVEGAGPAIVFLPGYASDMTGSKATALMARAAETGRACLLFDYAGCGESDGQFADQTLECWRDDALAVIADQGGEGPLLLVGSSMGGWLMLLVALAIPHRIAGLVGIAAAPDFTDWGFSAADKGVLVRDGRLLENNPYGPEPTLTTLAFWESGERNRLLHAPIPLACPVRLLHGQADPDVPFDTSMHIAARLHSHDVTTILVKDGDHRLSRAKDITLLLDTVEDLLTALNAADRGEPA